MVNFAYFTVIGTFIIAELFLLFSSLCHYLYGAVSLIAKTKPSKPTDKRPMVSILIPVYNEKDVARHAIEGCLALDYPKDRFEIIVIDDSNDSGVTGGIIDEYPVRHIVRQGRFGYKAGALNAGLKEAKGEIISVFDADFAPESGYLKKMVGHFEDSGVAVVQGKWKYRNEDANTMTKCASMMSNAFYGSVMRYRDVVGTAIFSGSGGAVRKSALGGGFRDGAIAEDLDVSLRLLGNGWKTVFAEEVMSIGEAPSSFRAFVRQQTRWAFGTTQALLNNWKSILFSGRLNLMQKFELISSSGGYLVTPMIVLLYGAGMINSATRWLDPSFMIWTAVTVAGLGYFFEIGVGSVKAGNGLDLAHMPALFGLLLVSNIPIALGVADAVAGKKVEFKVTPKGGT